MRRHAGALLALLLAACGGGEPIEPSREPQAVAIVQGNLQSGLYGTTLPVPLQVVVSGANGPIPDYPVTFSVEAGGGSLSSSGATTDANGVATLATWTLGPAPGANQVRATAGSKSIAFAATAVTGPPTSFVLLSGNNQSATGGSRTPQPPVVQVSDGQFGVPGITVNFAVTSGDGTVTPATVVTDEAGMATTVWRMGTAGGTNTMTASTAGFAPVTFTANAVPLVLSSLVKVSGDGSQAFVNNFAGSIPVVEVRDQFGQGAEGQTVTFVVTGGGGSVAFPAVQTDQNGRASPGAWRFGSAGGQALSATVAGLPSEQFNGTATTPPPGAFNIDQSTSSSFSRHVGSSRSVGSSPLLAAAACSTRARFASGRM